MGRTVCDGSAFVGCPVKITVTGATGFVGRHVVRALMKRRDIEIVAASRSGGSVDGVEGVAFDISGKVDTAYADLGSPDVVLHLAWNGLPSYRSAHHIVTEMPAQFRFLSTLADQGLKRLVGVGTCFEYGIVNGALDEGMPTHPDNPYGLAKDCLNKQLAMVLSDYSCSFAWARLFYMFGEGQAPTSLYALVAQASRDGNESFAMSGGEQLRDYLPVEDVAAKLVALAIDTDASGTYNICSGKPRAVRSLVEEWFAARGASPTLDLGVYPYPDYEPFAFWGTTEAFSALEI